MQFPELEFLDQLIPEAKQFGEVEILDNVAHGGDSFPIYGFTFGSKNPAANCLTIIGGVHGQEKIGSQVALTFLDTFLSLVGWDSQTQKLLESTRISFLPIANPVGMSLSQRPNGNGVDIMRNAPLDPKERTTFLLGGQSYSKYLPWYQGPKGAPMQKEAQALCNFIRKNCFQSRSSIVLDVHSGFGAIDRLWFPYAKKLQPPRHLAEFYSFLLLLNQTHPSHVYRMEPVAQGYTINGDLWDYLYDEFQATNFPGKFLPFTLEMGSWLWLKKNPAQILDPLGFFHPIHAHRTKRILRRHHTLFDFLIRAVDSSNKWINPQESDRAILQQEAMKLWYS